jgi:hypothetical protein
MTEIGPRGTARNPGWLRHTRIRTHGAAHHPGVGGRQPFQARVIRRYDRLTLCLVPVPGRA